MFEIDSSDVKALENDLKAFAKKAFPFATKATVNRAAFTGRNIALSFVKGKMIERNRFTAKSIQVEKAHTLNVSQQFAVLGSTEEYMATQEFGGAQKAKPIPTPQASGETALPRRRLPRKPNKFSNIKLKRGARPGDSRRAKNRAAVMAAAAKGASSKFVYLELGRRAGIYRVFGEKRKPRIRKIYDMSRRSVTIPPRPWLKPATDKAAKEIPRYYRDALIFQLKRLNILGYS